jgi:hypothetical protein
MTPIRPGLELRMVLTCHKPWVVRNLHYFHHPPIGGNSCHGHSLFLEGLSKSIVYFIPVSMAFIDLKLSVSLMGLGVRRQHAGETA